MKLTTMLLCGALAAASPAARAQMPPPPKDAPEGMRPPSPQDEPVSPADEEKLLAFLKEAAPDMHEHLQAARRGDPEAYHHHLRELMAMYRDPDMRQVFARNVRAEAKVRSLADEVRRAPADKKDAAKKGLEAALSEQFDAKLGQQELQVKKMEAEIVKLKSRIESRRSLKDKIVKKRLGELTGEDGDPLDW